MPETSIQTDQNMEPTEEPAFDPEPTAPEIQDDSPLEFGPETALMW